MRWQQANQPEVQLLDDAFLTIHNCRGIDHLAERHLKIAYRNGLLDMYCALRDEDSESLFEEFSQRLQERIERMI